MKLNQLGQSLIEALIALGAATVIVSAISVAIITSVNNSDFGKNQNLATQYSQQGMEILKQKSQSSWQVFSGYSGTYCLNEGETNLILPSGSTCSVNISNFFRRTITIAQASSSCGGNARVSVSVAWADGKCTSASNPYCHNVTLDSCLANINGVPTP